MRYKISNLYNQYNYDLDLSKNINALIGQNGSGKSTVLKTIKYLHDGDFSSLAKIYFDSISLTLSGTDLENIYIKKLSTKEEPLKEAIINISYKDLIPNKIGFNPLYRELFYSDVIPKYDFMADIKNKKFNFEAFYHFIMNKFKSFPAFTNQLAIDPYDVESYLVKDEKQLFNKEGYDFNNYEDLLFTDYDKINIAFFICLIDTYKPAYCSKLYYYCIYYYFLVKSFIDTSFDEDYKKYIYSSFVLYYNNLKYDKDFNLDNVEGYYKKNKDDITLALVTKDSDMNKLLLDNQFLFNCYYENLLIFNKLAYESIDYIDYVHYKETEEYHNLGLSYNEYKKILNYLFKDLDSDTSAYEKAMNHKLCGPFFLNYLNDNKTKLFINYLKAHYKVYGKKYNTEFNCNSFYEKLSNNKIKVDTFVLSYFKEFIDKKTTIQDWFFKMSDRIIDLNKKYPIELPQEELLYFAVEFSLYNTDEIEKRINYILSHMELFKEDNSEFNCFYTLTNKYFVSKKFKLYYDDNLNLDAIIIDKNNNILEPSMLSSGEYKMLRIIKMIAFINKVNLLLIDEIELSLSVYWQKMIIDDILKYNPYMKVIITTQSPSLFNEDNLKYAVPLKNLK